MTQQTKIAIIDDDMAMREALEDLIQSYGYVSEVFSSAEDFLRHEDHLSFNCMLVDVMMPGLSGIELQEVLNSGVLPHPPIIFMTSYRDDLTRKAAMQGGAMAFLGKPVKFDDLISCLHKALER